MEKEKCFCNEFVLPNAQDKLDEELYHIFCKSCGFDKYVSKDELKKCNLVNKI
jgi:hypothetical protein